MNATAQCCLALALALCATADTPWAAEPAPQTVFYVASTGDDKNEGTVAAPFATLTRARSAVRDLVATGLRRNLTVLIRGGRYEFSEPLVFGPLDSGSSHFSITYAAYPNEKVLLSGGRQITGWQKTENDLWKTDVPEVKSGNWYFRDLFVNDKRATRARKPNLTDKVPYFQILNSTLSDDGKSWVVTLPKNIAVPWKNLSDVELVALQTFSTVRKLLHDVNTETGSLVLQPPHLKLRHSHILPSGRSQCYLENALAFLDQPGEWYLDRATGELRYWPREGEDLTKAVTVASCISHLIEVKGVPGRPVRNLHFRSLAFSHTAWQMPQVGYMGAQAAFFSGDNYPQPPTPGREANLWERMDAALSFEHADSCTVQDCEISHTGATGVQVRRGCSHMALQGNHVFDTGGNGIMVGEGLDWFTTPGQATSADGVLRNRVTDNVIHACGAVYPDAVGIWAGMVQEISIEHNLVFDLPYSGISVGWDWGNRTTSCRNNLIANNHIHHVLNRLTDGGGIYTLGKQPGTVIRGNVIHDIGNSYYHGNTRFALYFDEGGASEKFLVQSNCIYNTGGGLPVKTAFAPTWRGPHIWRDNILAKVNTFRQGILGSSMLFTTADYLDVDHDSSLEPPHLTIEAWVWLGYFPKDLDPTIWIVNKNTNEFTNGHYALAVSHQNVGAYLNIGGGRAGCFAAWSQSNPIQTNVWQHLAMTYDGNHLKVYCDGVLQNGVAVNRPRTTGTGILRVGKRADNHGCAYHCLMDEIRVYNRALSAEEIRNRFSVPTSPAASLDPQVERSVIVSWPFDDVQQRIELGLTQAGPREPYRSRLAGNATSALLRPEKAPAATEMERPASSLTAPTVATAPHAKEPLLTQAVRLAGPATEPPGSLFLSRGDRIVAFGDSITYAGGYLRYIDALLSEQFAEFEIPQIINKGIGGQKAENLVARFQKDVLDIKPAVVLISIGINDVWHRLKSPHDETVLHAYERNLRKMVDMAQAAGIKVVLLTPTIIMEDRMAEGNLRLLQYDLAMREIALEKQCRVANLHTLFLNALRQKPREMSANCLTSDGVHMKPLGNAIMALGVLRALGIPEEKIARATWSDPQ